MDKFYNFIIVLSFLCVGGNELVGNSTRRGKFWGVGIVRFENSLCTGPDNLMGICYSRRQCYLQGGVGASYCAQGLGVCCSFQVTCGNTTSANNTYFVSPGFPNTFNGGSACSLTIQKCSPDICQVRIDFLTLNLAQPDNNGNCVSDALYIIGGASTITPICGDNSGQHVYVDFDGSNSIQLVINTNNDALQSRAWNIKIAQIGCSCPTRAPAGCLMYYTALSGVVRSFNYGTTTTAMGTRQIANENYGVCIQMQPGYCSITWSASDASSFSVSGDTNNPGPDPPMMCTTDFVVIPNPTPAPPTGDRFCGNTFTPVTTSSKPFVLTVVTNENEVNANMANDMANRGFSLMYTQQRCTRPILG